MKIHSEAAFLVCLCLWIPVAHLQNSASPDDEASGVDEDYSGSGSGDEGLDVATQDSVNATWTAWVTDAPVRPPDQTTTQLTPLLVPDAQTSQPPSQAPGLHTTTVPAMHPPSKEGVTVKEVIVAETTTSLREETSSLPNGKLPELPQLPVTTDRWTTASTLQDIEEKTTKSVMLFEKVTMVSSEHPGWSTNAPGVESTVWTSTALGAREPADGEPSIDSAASTTVQITVALIEEKRNPGVRAQPGKANDDDFELDSSESERPQSESALGTSENQSLLEKKEVLAGVVAGGVVGLAFAVMLVSLMVYRMKKKDEGSYALDEHKHPNGGYCKPQRQEEFLA